MPRKSAAVARALSVLVEDEHREGDDPHPVAQLVDRVGGRQAPEGGPAQGVAQAWVTHCWPAYYLHFCTSFPADAQVSAKLCYKLTSN